MDLHTRGWHGIYQMCRIMNRSLHFNRGNARDAVARMGAGYTSLHCNSASLGEKEGSTAVADCRGWVEGGEAGDRILTGSTAGGSPGKLCGPTPACRRFFNSDKRRLGCRGQAPHLLPGTFVALESSSWLTHWASIGMRLRPICPLTIHTRSQLSFVPFCRLARCACTPLKIF